MAGYTLLLAAACPVLDVLHFRGIGPGKHRENIAIKHNCIATTPLQVLTPSEAGDAASGFKVSDQIKSSRDRRVDQRTRCF